MAKLKCKSKDEKFVISTSIVIMVLSVIIDHISKHIIVKNDSLIYKPISVIPGFFNLVSVRNTGAAFGMFHNNNYILLLVAFIAFVFLCLFFRKITESWTERYYALALIISGILGNSLDRIFRNSVVDFLDFYYKSYHWPAFNVADSAICIGVTILIISFIIRPSDDKKSNE